MKKIPLYMINIVTICLLALAGFGLVKLTYGSLPIVPTPLVVVTPQHEAATGLLAPFGIGYERELIDRFYATLPVAQGQKPDIEWRSAPSLEAALELVRTGQAHIAAGFGSELSYAALAGQERVGTGPVYQHANVVFAPLPSLEKNPPPPTEEGKLHMLDTRSWAVWEPFVGTLPTLEGGPFEGGPRDSASREDSSGEALRWFWNSQNPVLDQYLEMFWATLIHPDNTVLDQLEERYFGYLPDTTNPYAVIDFLDVVRKRLPRYSQVIAQAAGRANMDPLLFTAVIIQESRLNEGTVSHTGVQGIMQLTRETARYLGVDRLNPTQALRGGARYLRMIWSDLEGQGLEEWDRWFFTLAAFNQGPRRLEGARQLSRKLGGSGNTWRELKEVFPLLSQAKYAAMVGQSTCRGQEAVQFVERVRWYYHILRGLITLDRPEAQNLAPLLSSPIAGAALGF